MVRVSLTRVRQAHNGKRAIGCSGRYPHRNSLLNPYSTSPEVAFLKNGDFPHLHAHS
ncbi:MULTISPECIES: DUF924 family protein [Rhodobacterales]|uniref:DUF924 family protein n=1 Tax=Rhodobacterales TaxID=204455 RepID=UPI003425D329